MAVIALGGQTGGGARLLGPLVAQKLNADYVDRMILQHAARDLGATVGALHQKEERPPTKGERFGRSLQGLIERSAAGGVELDEYGAPFIPPFLTEEYDALSRPIATKGHEVADEEYVEALGSVLKELASGGNVVIVGRGSPIILRDTPDVLRVGLVANWWDCVNRIMEQDHLNKKQAEKAVIDRDKARAHYFNRFFGVDDPDKPEFYHLMINTSDVCISYAADLVTQAADAFEEGWLERGSSDCEYFSGTIGRRYHR